MLPGVGRVVGDTETWPNALPGVELGLRAGPTGVKETLTLASAAAPHVSDYDLSLPAGMSAVLAGDGAVNLTAGGKTVGVLPKPFMDDAAGVHSAAVGYILTPAGSGTGTGSWVLTATADPGWLAEAARVWPVLLDPTVYLSYGTGNTSCALVSGLQAGTSHCGDQSFGVGSSSGIGYDGDGNLTSRLDTTGTTTYRYDEKNDPTGKTLPSGVGISTGFDVDGNLTSYDDGGGTVTYGYNTARQLTGVTDPTGTITITPDNQGRRSSIRYPNGLSVGYAYDTPAGQVKTITPTGSALPTLSYDYTTGPTWSRRTKCLS